jgi:hypothetical protein
MLGERLVLEKVSFKDMGCQGVHNRKKFKSELKFKKKDYNKTVFMI